MVTKVKNRRPKASSQRRIGKPGGQIQQRVQAVGPERFGVLVFDCAKRRSKWMLCDFYGKILCEATEVEHTSVALRLMTQLVADTLRSNGLVDMIAAVEMTGIYHKPVFRACRKAGFDTRLVHPYASMHFRRPLHPGLKTDEHDLEAIFHAAINGYGLATLPVNEDFQSLQAISRHRYNLVRQRSRLMVQIRRLLHLTMPGFADLFPEDNLFHASIALPVAIHFSSAAAIIAAGTTAIGECLIKNKVRFQVRTIERIVAWAKTAGEPAEMSLLYTRQWKELNSLRELLDTQIEAAERESAGFLAKTPYILLLTVTGINVVSAARFAGEAGPIEHYASARALTGRAGLYPSRYQSDQIDRPDGRMVGQCNRKLRGAAMLVAENLIKCHPYYRGLSELWRQQKVDPRDRRCRVAGRAMRMVFQLVSGRKVWHGHGVDREYLLAKLQEFHRQHGTPIEHALRDLHEAVQWLPASTHTDESRPFVENLRKHRRGPKRIGDLLIHLLARLGGHIEQPSEEVKSNSSEARSSR